MNEREAMIQDQIRRRGVNDPATLEALRRVPRERFVPEDSVEAAYEDHPLPIGHDQTISQPYIVAYMTEALALKRTDRVLEIGTGSGYQTAVLAEIVESVYSIERVGALARRAAEVLAELGYLNVHVRHGDGALGWPDAAPFDGILVAAAAEAIPEALLEQLGTGGRLILPLGRPGENQELILVVKDRSGSLTRRKVMDVHFVPFRMGAPKS